jgi:hypothetical protein
VYSIDVDGSGPSAPFNVYCDMSTAGGGWQLVTVTRDGQPLIGSGYCLTPDPSVHCAGQLHPAQVSADSELLVRDSSNGAFIRYTGFSATAQSALRYFSRELTEDTSDVCGAANNVCANTTRDPELMIAGTSGFALDYSLPLKQWWRLGGWWVGGDPGADGDQGRIHKSSYRGTDMRGRTNISQNSTLIGSGPQALFYRAASSI